MIKAVFFDLDDTLCDSDAAWSVATKETFQLLRKYYPDVSEEVITKAWTTVHQELLRQLDAGKGSMAQLRDKRFHCLFHELDLSIGKITEELNDFLSSRYLASLRLYEDVSVLEKMPSYHVGIITNGAHDDHTDSQFSKVEQLGLSKRIQSLTISDEVGVRKPNVKVFQVACERAKVLPKEAMLVGNSIQNDIVGANRIGMTSVLIDRKSDVLIPKEKKSENLEKKERIEGILQGHRTQQLRSNRLKIPETGDSRPDYSVSNLHDVLSCLASEQD